MCPNTHCSDIRKSNGFQWVGANATVYTHSRTDPEDDPTRQIYPCLFDLIKSLIFSNPIIAIKIPKQAALLTISVVEYSTDGQPPSISKNGDSPKTGLTLMSIVVPTGLFSTYPSAYHSSLHSNVQLLSRLSYMNTISTA